MSKQDAQAFLEKITNDEDLQQEMTNLETSEERLERAKQYGYEFTKNEMEEARQETLSDADLDRVAGGSCSYYKYHI